MFRKLLNVILIFSCGATLAGCALAAVGGAGATYWGLGEYSKAKGKQKQALEKRVTRETRSQLERERVETLSRDEQVAGKINGRFISGELTKVIEIHTLVRDGVVYLYGNVPSGKIAERAMRIARHQKGVRDVVSYLSVVEMKITPVIGGKEIQLSDNTLAPRKRPGRQMNKEIRPIRPKQYAPPQRNLQHRLPQNPNDRAGMMPPSSPRSTQYNLVPSVRSDLRGAFNPLNIAPPLSVVPRNLMASSVGAATPLPLDDINVYYARQNPTQISISASNKAAGNLSGGVLDAPTTPNGHEENRPPRTIEKSAFSSAVSSHSAPANIIIENSDKLRGAGDILNSAGSSVLEKKLATPKKLSVYEFKIPADARGINHYVSNGEVLLYGTVANRNVEAKAIKIAKGIKGVKNVISKLKITDKEKSQIIHEADKIISKMARDNKITKASLAVPTIRHKKLAPIDMDSYFTIESKVAAPKIVAAKIDAPFKARISELVKSRAAKMQAHQARQSVSPNNKSSSKDLAVPPNYTMSQLAPSENMDIDEFGNMVVPSSGLLIIPNASANHSGYSYQ